MTVSLPNKLEQYVQGKVSTGVFENASEVVSTALSRMKDMDMDMDTDEEQERNRQLAWLQAAIQKGWDEAQEGKGIPMAEVKASMAKFKENWKREHLSQV